MTQQETEQATADVTGAQVSRAAPEPARLQVQSLPALEALVKKSFISFDLENLLKKYFITLQAIAEVECKFCDEENTECEHKLARQALDIEF